MFDQEKNVPHCCIWSLPPTTFCSQRLGEHCALLFVWVLFVTQRPCALVYKHVSGRKATRISGETHVFIEGETYGSSTM
jgi:hypothetical protein